MVEELLNYLELLQVLEEIVPSRLSQDIFDRFCLLSLYPRLGRRSWRRRWMRKGCQMRRYSPLCVTQDALWHRSDWLSHLQKVTRRSQHARKETEFLRLKRTRLGLDDFESLKVIGRGAFGEVKVSKSLVFIAVDQCRVITVLKHLDSFRSAWCRRKTRATFMP